MTASPQPGLEIHGGSNANALVCPGGLRTRTHRAWGALCAALLGLAGCIERFTVECGEGMGRCGGACVDLKSDGRNCGACGNSCLSEACSQGSCVPGCPAGLNQCSGSCCDLATDRANCGACGSVCADGQVCSSGECVLQCPTGQADCSGTCRDLSSDDNNCGACGTACVGGKSCVDPGSGIGACQCPTGQADCSGTCRDLSNDNDDCGVCGKVCPGGQSCGTGTCACPSGTPNACGAGAGGYCSNFQTDSSNCGVCGKVCPGGSSCNAGGCKCDTAGYTLCPGGCYSLANDPLHCGQCTTACPGSQPCIDPGSGIGVCECPAPTPDVCGSGASTRCVDLSKDPANCGSCGNICTSGLCDKSLCQPVDGRAILIDNSGGAHLTNYQISFAIDSASLVSGGKMRTDCGDIRLRDSDDTTSLSYFLESGCNTATTTLWVKVPDIPAGARKTIYLHWNNPSLTSLSSADATFIFFDGFASGLSKWSNFGSPLPAAFADAGALDGWSYSSRGDSGYISGSWYTTLLDLTAGIVMESRQKQLIGSSPWDHLHVFIGAAQNGYNESTNPGFVGYSMLGANVDSGGNPTEITYGYCGPGADGSTCACSSEANDQAWHRFTVRYAPNNTTTYYRDGALKCTATLARPFDQLPLLLYGRSNTSTNFLDYVRVRAFANPEPTIIL